MAHGGLQVLGLLVALAGWGALLVATVLPHWETYTMAGTSVLTAVATYQGLWMACHFQSTGQLLCESYKSLLALPGPLQAARALMVAAAALGPLALGLAVSGMKCTRCGSDDPRRKARLAAASGGVFLLAGLSGLVACSWYGHRIISNFYDPLVPVNNKFELGPAIFLGWAGAALALLGGALLASSCPTAPHARRAPRKPAARGGGSEYV